MATSSSTARNQLAAMQKAAQRAAAQRAAAQRAAQQAAAQRAAQQAAAQRAAQQAAAQQAAAQQASAQRAAQQKTLQAAQLAAQQRSASRMAPTAPSNPQLGQFNPGGVFNPSLPMINPGQQAVDNRREFMTSLPTLPPEVQIRMTQLLREAEQRQSQMQQAQPLGGFGAQIGAAPQQATQQAQPFRPIEGLSGNLVGGFTPPPFGQQMPAQNMGFLQGMPPPGQQGMSQQALDVTQGSMAYPPSFSAIPQALMGQMGQQAMGLGMPQQGQMQSATQAAFQQAAQRTPSNQLNMYSGMPQQATPMQSNMGGQSNMFSAPQQATPMQSNMNQGMGQGAQQSVGATSSNLFGGGPFASATQSGQQAQQPQQSNAPVRTGGVF